MSNHLEVFVIQMLKFEPFFNELDTVTICENRMQVFRDVPCPFWNILRDITYVPTCKLPEESIQSRLLWCLLLLLLFSRAEAWGLTTKLPFPLASLTASRVDFRGDGLTD